MVELSSAKRRGSRSAPRRGGLSALHRLVLVSLTIFGLPFMAGPTVADDFDAAKHFKGKSMRLVVDFKPGGNTDIQARYFAANWGKFIPGNPRIAVTNLFPNPAGRNYTWKSAPDGLTLSFLGSLGIGDELVDSTAQFETDKFTQIGSHAKRDLVIIARSTLPYNSIPEGKGSKTVLTFAEPIGSAEDISGKMLAAGLLAIWFDVPMRIATVARSGLADSLVLLERGDVNGYIAGTWYAMPTLRPGWFASGFVKPIADLGHPASPSTSNGEISMPLPNAFDWLNEEQKAIWSGIFLPDVLSGKSISGPPNIRPEITKVLRDSYVAAVSDSTFTNGLEKLQGQPVALIQGERLQALVIEATKAFKEQLPRYTEFRQQVYDKMVR